MLAAITNGTAAGISAVPGIKGTVEAAVTNGLKTAYATHHLQYPKVNSSQRLAYLRRTKDQGEGLGVRAAITFVLHHLSLRGILRPQIELVLNVGACVAELQKLAEGVKKESLSFINLCKWRPLNHMEINAIGYFWKSFGDSMQIEYKGYLSIDMWKDGIEFVGDITI
ncbi:hypothetical protein QBC33DRAFT_603691 [Phialemonium atrogriseum]|uniref:Uncharacterized protein n=1 Tax=Phialemonium atrogriseum TaxID=1093897 RepID=A0AAJ0BP37_9PEZI|nr:uncharacterized protein QBC33DRAFT_603691 [Phialemonium atrogriseum]KAK1761873.1 hypothetical protein QBC33DRAFT_603691 [Phialemonium atrogriseum]